ncbi:helix-turn-helix transcriptional regulator [Streptomyces sp. Ru62]|nr:helix-turn-helix transcriptional regulator [Streptomyces sp. Ru62]
MGREAETDRILRLLDACGDQPRALLIVGEAGTGKTHLLRAAGKAAGSRTRVLSAQGWEPESTQRFASLHQLLLPVLDELDTLPPSHRTALGPVLGPGEGGVPPDGAALRLAVLALVDRLAQEGRVLLAVDDIQDCDRDSMNVLLFVTRRLTNPAVTALFTARGQVPPPWVPGDLPVLPLGELPPGASARLLDAQPGAPTGRARLELLRRAEGNPSAIVELCRAGSSARREPGEAARVQQMFGPRMSALPHATQRALLYAATASPYEDLTTVMAAVGEHDLRVWTPAESAGLITIAGGRLTFRNPLVRMAALLTHSVRLRQRAHRELAALSGHSLHRARHLAAAAVGTDESVAMALEEAAVPGPRAVSCFDAARALEEAADLTPAGEDRARRLAKALFAASFVGEPEWVRDLYARFTREDHDPELRCAAVCAMSGALSALSLQREAFDLLLGVWQDTPPADPATAHAMAAVAMGIAAQSGLPEHRAQLPRLFDLAGRTARERGRRTRDDWFVAEFAQSDALASLETLARAGVELSSGTAGPPHEPAALRPGSSSGLLGLVTAALRAHHVDESDVCAELGRQALEPLRSRGAVGLLAWILPGQVESLLNLGRWAEAGRLIEEGGAHAAVHRLTRLGLDLEALGAILRALRGESVPEQEFPGSGWAAVSLDENRATQARMLRACGLTAMTLGDAEGAYRHLRSLFTDDCAPLDPFLSPRCVAEFAVAAQHVGRQHEAARVLEEVRRGLGPRPTTRMRLLMHHAAALVAEDTHAERHFRLATDDREGDRWPLERARARLHYAIWLRRRRRPREARVQLTIVVEVATRLGARHLAMVARGELRATGVPRRAAVSSPLTLSELTSQEQRIVRLAARGLSNREIGERMFLSPRTVSTHLYKVYPKLGISRRHQLRDLVPSD